MAGTPEAAAGLGSEGGTCSLPALGETPTPPGSVLPCRGCGEHLSGARGVTRLRGAPLWSGCQKRGSLGSAATAKCWPPHSRVPDSKGKCASSLPSASSLGWSPQNRPRTQQAPNTCEMNGKKRRAEHREPPQRKQAVQQEGPGEPLGGEGRQRGTEEGQAAGGRGAPG